MPRWYGGSALNPDEIVPQGQQWTLQWERMGRWYRRVRKLKDEAENRELSHEDMDTIIAFFQNCYHVRDWIEKCKPDLKSELDQLFAAHFEMGACRDICHGFKHKNLNRPTHDADFNFYREWDPFQEEIDPTKSSIRYSFAFADGPDIRKFDAFALAEGCYDIWSESMASKGLLNASSPPRPS